LTSNIVGTASEVAELLQLPDDIPDWDGLQPVDARKLYRYDEVVAITEDVIFEMAKRIQRNAGPVAPVLQLVRGGGTEAKPSTGDRLLTAQEAAQRLGCAKPNGVPRDSFYKHIAPKIGHRRYGTTGDWVFPERKVEALRAGEIR